MQALVLTEKGASIILQEKPLPQPGSGEALVKLYAAALNHRDVWIQKGMYSGLHYPITPGSDGAGVEIGTGREVIINPSLQWGNSLTHQDQQSFKILGLPDDGTFAEFVKAPIANLADKPGHLSFEEAAALPLAGLTAYRALFTRAQLRPGERVLITGIGGGVALFSLQFALAAGARVYVSSGDDEKIKRAVALGARGGTNYNNPHWVAELEEQAGSFEVTVDGAGGAGMGSLLHLSSPGGRLVFYGATRGNAPALEARRIFWKQLNILGSTMGSPEDFMAMVNFVNKHAIRPVVDKVFPLREGETALRRMEKGSQFGKIVLRIH